MCETFVQMSFRAAPENLKKEMRLGDVKPRDFFFMGNACPYMKVSQDNLTITPDSCLIVNMATGYISCWNQDTIVQVVPGANLKFFIAG